MYIYYKCLKGQVRIKPPTPPQSKKEVRTAKRWYSKIGLNLGVVTKDVTVLLVLFELFPLNKFVFNTPNKSLSQAVCLCSAVFFFDAIGPTVYLLLIYF
jgi:hypothetical protein